jgi:uncharacterized protein YndB with AHSA1/START domain
MGLRDFKTRIKIKAEPVDVFAAFTNPFAIELWSGYPAVMPAEAGGEFSMWNGDIEGRVLELIPESKIVQEWYFGDQKEPSVVTIKIFPNGTSSQVDLFHSNIPDDAFDDISEGWTNYFLGAIKEFLEVE